jgi:hypothetical protein
MGETDRWVGLGAGPSGRERGLMSGPDPIQNPKMNFKLPNLICSKSDLPELKKNEIKYRAQGFELRNNVPY